MVISYCGLQEWYASDQVVWGSINHCFCWTADYGSSQPASFRLQRVLNEVMLGGGGEC